MGGGGSRGKVSAGSLRTFEGGPLSVFGAGAELAQPEIASDKSRMCNTGFIESPQPFIQRAGSGALSIWIASQCCRVGSRLRLPRDDRVLAGDTRATQASRRKVRRKVPVHLRAADHGYSSHHLSGNARGLRGWAPPLDLHPSPPPHGARRRHRESDYRYDGLPASGFPTESSIASQVNASSRKHRHVHENSAANGLQRTLYSRRSLRCSGTFTVYQMRSMAASHARAAISRPRAKGLRSGARCHRTDRASKIPASLAAQIAPTLRRECRGASE